VHHTAANNSSKNIFLTQTIYNMTKFTGVPVCASTCWFAHNCQCACVCTYIQQTKQAGSSCYASDLYSISAQFKPQSREIILTTGFVIFLSSYWLMKNSTLN